MGLRRVILALLLVGVLSLGVVGTALAAKPDKAGGPKGKALNGLVVSTPTNSNIQLDTKRAAVVTVKTTAGTQFEMPGGKRLSGIFKQATQLRAGDRVALRGAWTDDDEFTATHVKLTGKSIKRFNGEVAATNGSITVAKDDGETKTFSLAGATILPSGSSLSVGSKVQVIYHAGDDTVAMGVLVKK